jgi:hypothetical protein
MVVHFIWVQLVSLIQIQRKSVTSINTTVDTHNRITSTLARQTNTVVISVEYAFSIC